MIYGILKKDPDRGTAEGGDVEEERRLFYVAMTRAKELLYVFSVKRLYNRRVGRSRFLEELLEVGADGDDAK